MRFRVALAVATAVLAQGLGAKADTTTNTYALLNNSALVQAVRNTGTNVLFDPSKCWDSSALGYYLLEWDEQGDVVKDELGICVHKHGTDYRELGDTVRHEALHVAQACNGSKAILGIGELHEMSTPAIRQIVSTYPVSKQHRELEAFVGAHHLSNDDVRTIVNHYCSK